MHLNKEGNGALLEEACQRNGEDCSSCGFGAIWLILARYPLVAEGMQRGPGACPLAVTPSFSLPLSPSQQQEEQGRGCGHREGCTEIFWMILPPNIYWCRMLLCTAPHGSCKTDTSASLPLPNCVSPKNKSLFVNTSLETLVGDLRM